MEVLEQKHRAISGSGSLPGKIRWGRDNPKTSPGSILVKGDRSRYLGLGDLILMLDHVSKLHVEERAC